MIRLAEQENAETLRAIALASAIDAWSVKDYKDEIKKPDSIVIVWSENDRIEGFLLARIVPGISTLDDAEIFNIAVSEHFRRRGIAKEMFRQFECIMADRKVSNVWLEVRAGNDPAIAFYTSLGFISETLRRKLYSNPTEDGLVMRLELAR